MNNLLLVFIYWINRQAGMRTKHLHYCATSSTRPLNLVVFRFNWFRHFKDTHTAYPCNVWYTHTLIDNDRERQSGFLGHTAPQIKTSVGIWSIYLFILQLANHNKGLLVQSERVLLNLWVQHYYCRLTLIKIPLKHFIAKPTADKTFSQWVQVITTNNKKVFMDLTKLNHVFMSCSCLIISQTE